MQAYVVDLWEDSVMPMGAGVFGKPPKIGYYDLLCRTLT